MRWVAGVALFLASAMACGSSETASPTISPLPTLVPTQVVVVTATPTAVRGTTTYVVKAGDTLSAIAAQFGTTVEAIVKANDIKDPDFLSEGQELIIPRP